MVFDTKFATLSNQSGYAKTQDQKTVNPYYNWYESPSADWHNSIVAEVIQNRGVKVRYLRRNMENPDYLFGEDPNNSFDDAYEVAVYMESLDRYEGQGRTYDFMGYSMKDEVELLANIDLFKHQADGEEPLEGDLIYIPMVNALFEIKFIDPEDIFYQFGNLPVRRMQCQKFTYSHEYVEDGYTDEETGVTELISELTNLSDLETDEEESTQIDQEASEFQEFNPNDPFNTGYNEI